MGWKSLDFRKTKMTAIFCSLNFFKKLLWSLKLFNLGGFKMTWDQKEYERATKFVRELLTKIRQGELPLAGEYNHYVVYKTKATKEIWIEIPNQILPDVIAGFGDVVKDVKAPVIGYSFYESAFIRVA